MNFIKTFLISLVIYLGLNTVFVLISMFVTPGFPMTDVLYIIAAIFYPISVIPGEAWIGSGIVGLITASDIVTVVLTFLWLIIPPLIAIIIGARIGENSQTGFGAWFLVALISCGVYALLLGIGQAEYASPDLTLSWIALTTSYGAVGAILSIFIAGVINGFFYGCISLLLANRWM
jgi:hypothetical protein